MPFTETQFFDVFRQYNNGTWPMPLVITVFGIWLAGAIIVRRISARIVWWSLAALWAWMSLAYHLKFFATINPLAYAFAVIFLIEAAAFVVFARGTSTHGMPEVGGIRARVSDLSFVYALVLYPLIGLALGQRYPGLPSFGLPCPTTIFTIGVLIRLDHQAPSILYLIPLIWSAIALTAASTFHVGQDYLLLPFAGLGLALRLWPVKATRTRKSHEALPRPL